MNRKTADAMRTAIEAAIQRAGLEDRFDATFETLKGVYDVGAGTYELKVRFSEATVNQAQVEFERHCRRYGFLPSDYAKTFEYEGATYALIGFNTRAPKFPYVCRNLRTKKTHRFHKRMHDLLID